MSKAETLYFVCTFQSISWEYCDLNIQLEYLKGDPKSDNKLTYSNKFTELVTKNMKQRPHTRIL
jgi:hypothetical protein